MAVLHRLFCFVALLQSVTIAYASEWQIDPERSRLGFVASYENIPFTGWFRKFSARIVFDPALPKTGLFDVSVHIPSVDSDSRDRDEGMLGKEWFHTRKFAEATFFADKFTVTSSNEFTATGDLTIKGITKTIVLPFTWSEGEGGKSAHLASELRLKRTDFQIGSGEWSTDPTIGYEVEVLVDLFLIRN